MTRSETWRALARSLIGDPEFTSVDVAQLSGVDLAQARRLWRALGFPPVPEDECVFTRSDVAVLEGVRRFLAEPATDPGVILQLTRATGQALARVAEAQVSASGANLEDLRSADPAEVPSAAALRAVESVVERLEPLLGYVWRRHLLAALLRFTATAGEAAADRAVAVGFADMVGFTAISQQLDDKELAAMVDRFEALAYEHIPERGGRVVKMIGDEVMFAAEDDVAAAEIALALVEACAADADLPDVRVGVALGPALSWEGDLFGPTVNLASRLVSIARPGTVLLSEDLGERLRQQESFDLRFLRPVRLKGIGRVRSWVLRRPSGAEA